MITTLRSWVRSTYESIRVGLHCVLLLSISCLFSLSLAEILVRQFYPQDTERYGPLYQGHPIYRFKPYSSFNDYRKIDRRYLIRTNSKGLREDIEIPYTPSQRPRIIFLGDSFTFGLGVEKKDAFVTVAQQYLALNFQPQLEIINLGVPGYGPDLELLYFLEEGRKYLPNIVIIAVYLGNDLDDLVTAHSGFRLENGLLVYIPYAIPFLKRLSETTIYRCFADFSELLLLIRNSILLWQRQTEPRSEWNKEYTHELAIAEAVYKKIIKEIKSAGSTPILVFLPTGIKIIQERDKRKMPPKTSEDFLYQLLTKFCKRESLHCLDTLPIFASTKISTQKLFIPGDNHYTPVGHEVVGIAIGTFLSNLFRSGQISKRVLEKTHP